MNDKLTIKTAVKETLLTIFGYISIGIAFGIVGRASGLTSVEIFLMFLITYAGSTQFIIISLLLSHSTFLLIIFSTFLVNSRIILISMTVVPFFRNKSLAKNILLGSFLTDESFALSMNKINYIDHGWGFASLASALAGAFDKSTQVRFEVYTGSNVRRLALPSNNR